LRAVTTLGKDPPPMARPKTQDTPAASHPAPAAAAPNAAADAFAKIEPELAALRPEEILAFPEDLQGVVGAALAAVPRIRAYREAIAAELPNHPIDKLDHLESYARGALYAYLVHAYSDTSPEKAKELHDEATKLRDGLLIGAEALAHRNLLDADAVAHIRKGHGNADLAGDLVALAALFRESWGKVSSKTAVEKQEIDRAAELGPAVLVAVAAKKHAGKSVDTDAQRARAYTLLIQAYESCRQALTYLRWKEGDADSIAPSLTKKRAGRKPGVKKEDESPAEAPEAG
jgi:hypothetical protein